MLTLHTLKPAAGASKQRKRVGRGNASGHGNYSCKGLKGQKSRSGVSGLKRMALKKAILQIPKLRGFHSDKPKFQVVNLAVLNNFLISSWRDLGIFLTLSLDSVLTLAFGLVVAGLAIFALTILVLIAVLVVFGLAEFLSVIRMYNYTSQPEKKQKRKENFLIKWPLQRWC